MSLAQQLLQINFQEYKTGILCFITAFVVAVIIMPLLIMVIKRYNLYDLPDGRKEHSIPVPTMGGIAIGLGMGISCLLWFPQLNDTLTTSFFFSFVVLFFVGIMDDLKDLPAYYKFAIQLAVALLITLSGARITTFDGLLGIYALPVAAQYIFSIITIVGITNAFNLIDGIDGLAGGLGFMSLVALGIFLNLSGEPNLAVVAFALAGSILGFLYFNFNPARIFMGDTGSLVLGFTISVLCIRLIQANVQQTEPMLQHAPVFALSIVLIPVFDTLRVFALRARKGKSPFHPDKTHIHHLLTNNGWSHSFTTRLICTLHAGILLLGYFGNRTVPELGIFLLIIAMLLIAYTFRRLKVPVGGKRLQLD